MDDDNYSTFKKDDLYKTLERINLWIGNCDAKTSVAMSAIGVFFAILLAKDYAVKFKTIIGIMIKQINLFSVMYLCITTISIALTCVGYYCLFRVLVPRTNINLYKESGIQTNSLIFFSSIANNNSFRDFSRKIEESSESMLRNDLISQIYICSKVCDQKFLSYKRGITFALMGLAIFACLMIVGLIIT